MTANELISELSELSPLNRKLTVAGIDGPVTVTGTLGFGLRVDVGVTEDEPDWDQCPNCDDAYLEGHKEALESGVPEAIDILLAQYEQAATEAAMVG